MKKENYSSYLESFGDLSQVSRARLLSEMDRV